jgi:hypothetical protein
MTTNTNKVVIPYFSSLTSANWNPDAHVITTHHLHSSRPDATNSLVVFRKLNTPTFDHTISSPEKHSRLPTTSIYLFHMHERPCSSLPRCEPTTRCPCIPSPRLPGQLLMWDVTMIYVPTLQSFGLNGSRCSLWAPFISNRKKKIFLPTYSKVGSFLTWNRLNDMFRTWVP